MDCSSLNWDWAACVACSLPNTLTDNVEIRKLNMMFKKKNRNSAGSACDQSRCHLSVLAPSRRKHTDTEGNDRAI